jgi:hypothetical protein
LKIGVFIPEFHELLWGQPYKGFADEAAAVFRSRLNDFLKGEFSERINRTFTALDSDLDALTVGEELSLAIGKKVLPCFDSFENYRSLHDFIDSIDSWQKDYPLMQIYFALLKRSLGEKESALVILDGVIAGKIRLGQLTHSELKLPYRVGFVALTVQYTPPSNLYAYEPQPAQKCPDF